MLTINILYIVASIGYFFIQYKLLKNLSPSEFKGQVAILIATRVCSTINGLIILNLPAILIWHYMRKNNFLAPEFLDNHDYLNYIGVDLFILFSIIFTLPIMLLISKNSKGLSKFIGGFFTLFIIIGACYAAYSGSKVLMPTLAIMAFIFGYPFFSILSLRDLIGKIQLKSSVKYNFPVSQILLTLYFCILIYTPSCSLDKFTENSLHRVELGGFNVKIRTDEKRVLEGFLLLKTNKFYYVNPICNGQPDKNYIAIIEVSNTTMIYKEIL